MRIIKYVITFIFGVIMGILGIFLYQVFGKPAKPNNPKQKADETKTLFVFTSANGISHAIAFDRIFTQKEIQKVYESEILLPNLKTWDGNKNYLYNPTFEVTTSPWQIEKKRVSTPYMRIADLEEQAQVEPNPKFEHAEGDWANISNVWSTDKVLTPEQVQKLYEESEKWDSATCEDAIRFEQSLEDTQPINIKRSK